MSLGFNEKERKSGELAWAMWWSRIRACQRFRQEYIFGERKWERYYNIYKILMWESGDEDYDISSDNPADRINVPIITSTILTIMPFLVNERAQYFLDPKRPQDVVNVMLKQKVLNDEFHRKEIQSQLKMSAYDGIIIGHGIAKSGFTREVNQAKTERVGDIEYDEMIDDESIYGKRVCPFNFWFDYNASSKNLDTARYTIERYFKYLPDIVENTSYKSSVREKIADGFYKPTMKESLNNVYNNTSQLGWLNESSFWNFESEMAILYEVWDRKYNQVLTFIDGVPEPLAVQENPYPYLKSEFPYVKMDFIYRPDEYYGMGVPEFTEHQGFELNRHRTYAMHHRRRFSARKLQILEDGIDAEEAEKLPDADTEYVFVKQQNAISLVPDVELPRDYIPIELMLKQDILESTGADSLARGQNLQSRATLGEVQVRTNILSLKLNERIAEIDRMFTKIGKQLASHIAAQYTKSQIVRLRGAQGEHWVVVNDEDLKDEVDVRMETVSAPKRNVEVEAQQKIQLFQFATQLLPLIQAGLIPANAINFVELLKFAMESFERVDLGRFFPSALNPVLPLQESALSSGEFRDQLNAPQQQQPAEAEGATSGQDLIRSISSGNLAGLQVAGAA